MAENLNYDIPGSRCYKDSVAYCNKYGRLYDWATAMALDSSCNNTTCEDQVNTPHQGICPPGWHIPSNADWQELVNSAGGESTAGTKLKAASDWIGVYIDTDDYKFSALPGGMCGASGSKLECVTPFGITGIWHSSNEDSKSKAYHLILVYYSGIAKIESSVGKNALVSVRCLKD